jgi:hypothetical protein
MGLAASILVAAVGFILALAVHPTHPGSVNVNTVGWILAVVGIAGALIDLLLWSSWGPAYARRMPAAPAPRGRRYGRRVVEEDEVSGPSEY